MRYFLIYTGIIFVFLNALFFHSVRPSFAEPLIIFESAISKKPASDTFLPPHPVQESVVEEDTVSSDAPEADDSSRQEIGESFTTSDISKTSEPTSSEPSPNNQEKTDEETTPAAVSIENQEGVSDKTTVNVNHAVSAETSTEGSSVNSVEHAEKQAPSEIDEENSATVEETTESSQNNKTPQIEFHDPNDPQVLTFTLQDVIQRTLQSNISIAVEEFQSKIKLEEVIEQRAVFDPNFKADFNVNDSNRQLSGFFADPNVTDDQTLDWSLGIDQELVTGTKYELKFEGKRNTTVSTFSSLSPQYGSDLTFSVTQHLLKDFGIDVNKTEIYIANNNRAITDFEFREKVIEIITEAENIYWDLVFSIEDLKVKQKSVERAKDLERRVKAQVEVGTMAPLEILQAKSEVASREEFVLDSQKLIYDNEDKVKNIINISFESPDGQKPVRPLDSPLFENGPPIDLGDSIKTALNNRPDYLKKMKELDNKNITVRYNENQTYPSLDLIGSFNLNGISGKSTTVILNDFHGGYGTSLDNLANTDYRAWEVGVALTYPLGNRAAKSRLNASKLEASQLLLDIKNKEKDVIVEVREAVRKINTDIKRVQAARIARQLAEEKLSAEEKKFEVGLSTSFNVLEFQTDLAEQQSKELKAIIDYNKSHINLRKVIASTLEENNIHLATPSSQ